MNALLTKHISIGLMEEKGIHNPTDTSSKGAPAEDGGSPTSGKKSFGQKIKDKLHRH